MDIDAIKTFLEVNRCRHFGQAAKNLYVSQSTVSARIKLLEDNVGLPLFVRERNNIQLTAAGEKFQKYAETIFTTWTRARQEIAIDDTELLPLVVGAQPSLWDSVLSDWMSYMYKTVPDIVMTAEVHGPEMLARRIQDQTMDIAFVFDNPHLLDFECKEVTHIPFILVSSEADLTIEDGFKQNYILVEWGTTFSVAHARLFPEIPTPHIRVMLGRIALDFILAHGGTAYMAEPMVDTYIADGTLHLIKDAPVITRSVFVLFPHNFKRSHLLEHACQYFSNSPEQNSELIRLTNVRT